MYPSWSDSETTTCSLFQEHNFLRSCLTFISYLQNTPYKYLIYHQIPGRWHVQVAFYFVPFIEVNKAVYEKQQARNRFKAGIAGFGNPNLHQLLISSDKTKRFQANLLDL